MRAEGVLLDIDGVLVVAWRAVPGAVEALRELERMGIPHCCITNTTSHAREELAATLAAAGFDVGPERIVTAASATAAHLRAAHRGRRAFVMSDGDPGRDMPGVELAATPENGEVMVLGGADETFGYDVVNRVFRRLMEGAPLVAMHRSAYWRGDDGYHLDAGGYVTALEAAAGIEAEVCGKPAASFFAAALDVLGLDAGRAAMVGDDVMTDVGAAQAAGLTGVLVRTGKFREGDVERGAPDAVIGSVADLPGWLAS